MAIMLTQVRTLFVEATDSDSFIVPLGSISVILYRIEKGQVMVVVNMESKLLDDITSVFMPPQGLN